MAGPYGTITVDGTPKVVAGGYSLNDGKVDHAFTMIFRVKFTDKRDIGPMTAIDAVSKQKSAKFGTPYAFNNESDLLCYAYDFKAEVEGEDGLSWLVTVLFKNYDLNYNNPDPLKNMPKVSWTHESLEEVAWADVNNAGILNSAGDYFDPPVTRDYIRSILRVVRNEAQFDASLVAPYINVVNSDPFAGFPEKTCKVRDITGEVEHDPNIGTYWVVTYEFAFDLRTWTREILDQGLRYFDTGTGTLKNITVAGVEATSPKLLDGSGQPIADPVSPASAVSLPFELYPAISFSVFNLTNIIGIDM